MNTFFSKSLPVEVVFHPSWWYKNTGITFDSDFFYHPLKRVESEQRMERELYERFGDLGLGETHRNTLPVIGAVHNAAGYLLSEMLGCEIRYFENQAPQVVCAHRDELTVSPDAALKNAAFKRLNTLVETLKSKFGYVTGDVNWGGILNLAIDLRGEEMLMDMMLQPDKSQKFFDEIATVIEGFTTYIATNTSTTSVSVNSIVRHAEKPIFLHSECTHTMISDDLYEQLLLPADIKWSAEHRPYGIHFCGRDPHRFAEQFAKIPHLDFLDLGWGGDVKLLREKLPNTFFSIRLDPVTI
ncbi:MAG: hypothetical protein LBN23_00495, partial [Paludibacter sp.]|nr:hypothetical protein [Paludibacter sp.]